MGRFGRIALASGVMTQEQAAVLARDSGRCVVLLLDAIERLLAAGTYMLAPVIQLVHQAHSLLLVVAAMNAEDDIPIGGAGVGRQVLLPSGQCFPAGGAGALAAAGVVDPVEESEDRDNQEQHQMIHHGVSPCGPG